MGHSLLFRVAYCLSLVIVVVSYPEHLPEPDLAFDFDSQTSTLTPGMINGIAAVGDITGTNYAFVAGVLGNAIELNSAGSDAYIHLGDQTGHCFSTPSLCDHGLTIGFWVQFNDFTPPGSGEIVRYILSSGGHDSATKGITIRYRIRDAGTSTFDAWFADDAETWRITVDSTIFAEDVWYHFTYVYNIDTGPRLYLYGIETPFTVLSVGVHTNGNQDLYVGANAINPTANVYGVVTLDRLRAWHDILDPFEVYIDALGLEHCHLDTDCLGNDICYYDKCTDPLGLVCMEDTHCNSGDHCEEHTCIPDSDHCHLDTHCGANQHCHEPICFDNTDHCEGDHLCPDGMHCLNKMCFDKGDPCDSDDDCLDGYHCWEPLCFRDDEYCKDDNDCGFGFHCHDTNCFDDTKHCHEDYQCGEESHCYETLCFTNFGRCRIHADCGDAHHCHEMACVENRVHCEKDSHCENDEHCYKTICLKDSIQCEDNKHCETGQHCHDAVCYPNDLHCHDNFVCGDGYHCHGQICYKNSVHCHSNSDCGPGSHCHDTICYTNSSHCHSDVDCPSKQRCYKTQCIDRKEEIPEELDMNLIIIVAPVTGVVTLICLVVCLGAVMRMCLPRPEQLCVQPNPPPYAPPCPPPTGCPPSMLRPPSMLNFPPIRRAPFDPSGRSRPWKGEPIF